jgi:predicted ATPase/DNA-binding CsgD family transcriptional regulator
MLDERQLAAVWWVELAAVSDSAAIGRAALAAMGVRPDWESSRGRRVGVELGDQRSLLVLDNCEHLIAGCATFVAELLEANVAVSVLATSREPLGVPGEITWRVPSLACPAPERVVDVPSLSQFDAVVLFVERARRARPSFTVSETNAPAVAEICHRLDGIPLAIELAAARCRQLSAERIAAELDDRFRLLTGGARTVMARQQTLAASIDWSYDRLDVAERITFRRLGAFSGAFPLEAAEAVVSALPDVEPTEVFDLICRLVDKSLVVADDDRRGETRYRLLETLRAYTVDRARVEGELAAIRDVHAAWWAAWLQPRAAMPSDDNLEEVEEYHDNLKAALDWSADQPSLGLVLLERLGRVWSGSGRASDAMAAADRLLSSDNAQHYGVAWLDAAQSAAILHFFARGRDECSGLLARVEQVALDHGDEYHVALARWHKTTSEIERVRDLAHERANAYVEAEATVALALQLADGDPSAALEPLRRATAIAAASRNREFREGTIVAYGVAARSTGDLARCIELATGLLKASSPGWSDDAVRDLGFAALLARDESSLRYAVEAGTRAQRKTPGTAGYVDVAIHRLRLLEGAPSEVDPELRSPSARSMPGTGWLWLAGREAIDAGAADVAVAGVGTLARPEPHWQAVVACIEAAATGDDHRWRDALELAVQRGLRLIAVDALEGLALGAARSQSWTECIRLFASAQRLRDETGYKWRFPGEAQAVTVAQAQGVDALGDLVDAAGAEGRSLDWRDAAAYAQRARGERKRPTHGWASLTPTEYKVAVAVAEGLTNPQIAQRLLMGGSTVKTHLEHIFTKLGTRTRAELAAIATLHRP